MPSCKIIKKIFWILLVICLIQIQSSLGQELEKHVINGKVISVENNQVVKDVMVNILGATRMTVTDNNGYFTLTDEFPAFDTTSNVLFTDLFFSHISYEGKHSRIGTSVNTLNDPVYIFYLKTKTNELRLESTHQKNLIMEKRGIIQKTYPQPPTNRNYVEHYGNIIMDDPKYPGDYKILLSHIEKMEQNASKGIGCCGRALIGFTVNEFGDVTNIKVFRSDNREVKNEAIRIVKNMKKWKPGIQLGKPVSVKYMMPFEFK